MLNQYLSRLLLRQLRHVRYGSLRVTTPDGLTQEYHGTEPGPAADLTLRDWSTLMAIARRGDIAFAEAYRDGRCDSSDLAELFMFALQNEAAVAQFIHGGLIGRTVARLSYLLKANTLSGSRENIAAHYDLGNDFYSLWLDPSMTYSAALFKDSGEDLMDAQLNKYDRILSMLNPSGRLLEIGCGWGGFAERALTKGDFEIKGLTISPAQCDYASARLGEKAVVAQEDYRLQRGTYDSIVSIEMFEAVGEKYWPVYFSKLKSLLAAGGKAVVQTITIGEEYFERYRQSGDAIRSFIFPGGMLPSPARFRRESAHAGLAVTEEFAFGEHYATTLERWLARFEANLSEVAALGFDQPFVRLWRLYLTSCIAGFRSGRINVMQMELQHAG